MRDLLLSTSLTPPRLDRPEAMTSAGEEWSSEEQARRDLELLLAILERATRWPPQRDLETRQWRASVLFERSTLMADYTDLDGARVQWRLGPMLPLGAPLENSSRP